MMYIVIHFDFDYYFSYMGDHYKESLQTERLKITNAIMN